jgi:hypothetical protein
MEPTNPLRILIEQERNKEATLNQELKAVRKKLKKLLAAAEL